MLSQRPFDLGGSGDFFFLDKFAVILMSNLSRVRYDSESSYTNLDQR
jgi:hypothetical protein